MKALRVVSVSLTTVLICAATAAFATGRPSLKDSGRQTPHIPCWFNHFSNWHERTRPHVCSVRLGFQHKFYRLRRMHWNRWNGDSAHGRGRDARHGGGSYPVRVELWKLRHGYPHDKLYYSKARVSIGNSDKSFSLAVPHNSHG
jgi:hypothetical protein